MLYHRDEHIRTDKGNQHMASQTRPFLMTGAALASAVAVVAATPAIAPGLTASPLSISNSGVNLATFSDVLTIPTEEWVASYFQGYGGIVGPNNPLPLEPWATSCDASTGGGCYVAGLSGIAYLALDALINGNGEGWVDNVDWGVSAVNYFFEGGTPGAGIEYLLQESVGQSSDVASVLITLLFTGPQLVTVVYDNALQLLGDAALNLPVLGEYVYGVINSYLGYASLDPNFQGYTQGLSGILNYAIDVVSGNAPSPTTSSASSAASLAASPAAAATALASAVGGAAAQTAPAVETVDAAAPVATDAVAAAVATGESSASESPAAADPTTEAAPAVDGAADAVAEVDAVAKTDSATTATATTDTDAPASEAASETKPAEAPTRANRHPVRDAVDKVTKSIGSALKGQKKADAATSGADSAS